MHQPIIKDRLLIWVLAGIIGSVAKDIFGLFTVLFGFADYHIVQVAADIFMNGVTSILSPGGYFIGLVTDLTIGGIFGVVAGLLLEWQGADFYIFKGIIAGLTIWLVFIGLVMHAFPQMFTLILVEAPDLINSLLNHMLYGAVTMWAIILLKESNSIPKKFQ